MSKESAAPPMEASPMESFLKIKRGDRSGLKILTLQDPIICSLPPEYHFELDHPMTIYNHGSFWYNNEHKFYTQGR